MRDEQMSDAALDRDIQEALAVQPSAEFAARVRSRLATEPKPAEWPIRGIFVGTCALAAVVVVVVVVSIPRSLGDGVSSPDVRLAPAPTINLEPRDAAVQPRNPDAPSTEANLRPRAHFPAVRRGPQVIVSPAELNGLLQMMAAVREGRLHAISQESIPFDAEMPLVPEPEIVVPPITIEPLDKVNLGEGVSQ